jgi:hypothetical protein
MFTTSSKGEVFLDIQEDKTGRGFSLTGSINQGNLGNLHQPLWLMGNTSISYSKKYIKDDDSPFAVIFDPAEVKHALDIPPEDVQIHKNTLFPGLAEPEPSRVICFPFAQHYIADSPGCQTAIKDRDDLIANYNKIAELDNLKTFSAITIIKQLSGLIAVIILIAVLLSLLL